MSLGPATALVLFATFLVGQDQPTFRSGTREVLVDTIVRDKSGKSVRRVSAAPFVVREDGRRSQRRVQATQAGTTAQESLFVRIE